MNEEESKIKAQYLIDKGYVTDVDLNKLASKIQESINNGNADHEAATSIRSKQP